MDPVGNLFSTSGFMPHGMCYMWNPTVIWLHVISDATIALAYYSIPITLVYFVSKRKDLAFDWMFLCFAAFIVACGTTHVMEILNIWHPTYWLSGAIKAFTGIISIVTAILLISLMKPALALPSPAQLREANAALEREIQDRKEAVRRTEQLNKQLLQQTSRLEVANKELESFAYSVSHDLRAPLRHIDGYVDMLREDNPNLGEESGRYLHTISESAMQMSVLIDNLLSFSRMGRADLISTEVDMAVLVEEVRRELSPDTAKRDIRWKIGPLPKVRCDQPMLRQVWMNLLDNAVKYTRQRETAEIQVGCVDRPNDYEFFVKDNGAGFDMQYADKLFGIFQRLHFKEEFEGTGIGLANVRRIIARHGGRTWAEGENKRGATFYFTIPKQG
jgi:signal transduction histidine kinase